MWLERNILTVPPPWDQAFYLYMSLRYLDALAGGGLLTLAREFVHLSPNVAPLFPLTTLPLYLLFGTSRLVAHLTSACYLWLLLVSVYLLGVYLHGRRAALLAVFCVATFPAVVNFSRDYLFEFPAAAVATLGLYALLRSEDFRHRSWCLLFGMLAGITVLTKTMNGVFFVGPVLYTVAVLIRRRQLDRARLIHGALAVGAGILVASIWWGPNFRDALGYLIYFGFKDGSAPYRTGGSDLLTCDKSELLRHVPRQLWDIGLLGTTLHGGHRHESARERRWAWRTHGGGRGWWWKGRIFVGVVLWSAMPS